MNATSIPKDIISVNELTMSIGEHLPPREVSQRRLTAERQCYLPPHAKPVYCKHCNIDWYNKDKLQQKDCNSGINIFKNQNHQCELVVCSAAESLCYRPRPKRPSEWFSLTHHTHSLILKESLISFYSSFL